VPLVEQELPTDHHCLNVLFIMELEIHLTCDIHLYSFPRRSVIDSKLGTINILRDSLSVMTNALGYD
jgi:hypothetical protein